ncbi:hypothetical protein CYMTET_39120 [Cymbomonas tetramitiformis]|uniref:E2F-associated phosphoprotein n=1 Tax=Cymbomonas tetramitiformis TaxID=36881 RepID=A0AAE0F5W8_9CHLO|nr:hypothetical protein CYMTET_39120 [Cymbomonas tetramitiformis]
MSDPATTQNMQISEDTETSPRIKASSPEKPDEQNESFWLSDDERESVSDEEMPEEEMPDFYDPAADDEDEQWMVEQRQGKTSDAILSCPCCLETLCTDCQKHARYENQFRAMFVVNCIVDRAAPKGGKKKTAGASTSARSASKEEMLYPVKCGTCNSEVGVFDEDEVYHFVNVFPTSA